MYRRHCLVWDWPDFWRWLLSPAQTPALTLERGQRVTGALEVENNSPEACGNWFGRCGLPLPRAEH